MHNGFVQVNEEKMSKSLGNFFTVREVLGHYQPEVLRCFILSSHYRSPLSYSTENLDKAKSSLDRLYTALRDLPADAAAHRQSDYAQRFGAAMDDDFNTPEALASLFELAREVNRARDQDNQVLAVELASQLRDLGGVLGLLQDDPSSFLQGRAAGGLSDAEIEQRIAARISARQTKNFKEADRIRDELASQGISLEDGAGGTRWRRS
jgi:cysteinyl-tRNA synthetase